MEEHLTIVNRNNHSRIGPRNRTRTENTQHINAFENYENEIFDLTHDTRMCIYEMNIRPTLYF